MCCIIDLYCTLSSFQLICRGKTHTLENFFLFWRPLIVNVKNMNKVNVLFEHTSYTRIIYRKQLLDISYCTPEILSISIVRTVILLSHNKAHPFPTLRFGSESEIALLYKKYT